MAISKPLYSTIIDFIEEKIKNGDLKPGDRVPTEMELAEQFKVSRITSKRALEELKRKGYISRSRGQGSFVNEKVPAQNTDSKKIVSIVLPYKGDDGDKLINYIRGASDYLIKKGCFLSIYCTEDDVKRERMFLNKLQESGIDGVIYYPVDTIDNYDVLNNLSVNNYPIVTIDKYYDCFPFNSVTSDNFGGVYNAVSELMKLGHKQIGFISSTPIEHKTSLRDRYFGYCKALDDNGIDIDNNITFLGYRHFKNADGTVNNDYIQNGFKKLIDSKITAIIAENDYIAVEFINTLSKMGVKLPNNMMIVGFDNVDVLNDTKFSVLTLEQDFYEIGKKAAETILDQIENDKPLCRKITVPVKLITK